MNKMSQIELIVHQKGLFDIKDECQPEIHMLYQALSDVEILIKNTYLFFEGEIGLLFGISKEAFRSGLYRIDA